MQKTEEPNSMEKKFIPFNLIAGERHRSGLILITNFLFCFIDIN